MNDTSKYVILICEGKTDKIALDLLSNQYLQSVSSKLKIKFKIFKGDFTIQTLEDRYSIAEPYDIEDRIAKLIRNYIDSLKNDGITFKDIIACATLSDLDGCYTKDENVIFNEGEGTVYDLNNNVIKTKDVVSLRKRNEYKKDAIEILKNTEIIKVKNKQFLPFKAFYYNLNMEHVFYGITDKLSAEEKEEKAHRIVSKYYCKPNDFIEFINSLPSISDDYKTSWDRISLALNPLKQLTNIKILFKWLVEFDGNDN